MVLGELLEQGIYIFVSLYIPHSQLCSILRKWKGILQLSQLLQLKKV